VTFPDLPTDRTFESGVTFEASDVELPLLDSPKLARWLKIEASRLNFSISTLSYILCSDTALHELNLAYLDHDTLTDILTFDLSDSPKSKSIYGECFISIDRIQENAASFDVSPEDELHRVLVHGLLHLCGLSDKTLEEKALMRSAEDEALARLQTDL